MLIKSKRYACHTFEVGKEIAQYRAEDERFGLVRHLDISDHVEVSQEAGSYVLTT